MVLLDANFDPEGLRVLRVDDQPIAVAYAVRRRVAMVADRLEPEQGWIPFFFVDPLHRASGHGRRVLTEATAWLTDAGCTKVDFSSYAPNYILPGLDTARYPAAAGLLASLGFTRLYSASAMDLPLVDHVVPPKVGDKLDRLIAKGFRVETPEADDLVALIRLAYRFNPDWARAIREAALAGLPLDRILVAREPGGAIIGWGMCGAYEAVVDRFGPFGVDSDHRGLGLGEILLHLCLERMRALGAHNAWFLWTGEQTPAGHLYRKTGFTTTRTFDILRAPLAEETS